MEKAGSQARYSRALMQAMVVRHGGEKVEKVKTHNDADAQEDSIMDNGEEF